MMNQNLDKDHLIDNLEALTRKCYLDKLLTELTIQTELMHAIARKVVSVKAQSAPNKERVALHDEIHEQLNQVWDLPKKENFQDRFESVLDQIEELKLPANLSELQKKERFFAQPGDNFFLKTRKKLKLASYRLSKSPVYFLNLFRKKKVHPVYWSHQVPVAALVSRHYDVWMIRDIDLLTSQFYLSLSHQYQEIKEWQEAMLIKGSAPKSADHLIEELENFRFETEELLNKKMVDVLDSRRKAFLEEWGRIGTLELSSSVVSEEKLSKQRLQQVGLWEKRDWQWRNALYALFEDWRSDLDIYSLRDYVRTLFDQFKKDQIEKYSSQIKPDIHQVLDFISLQKKGLSAPEDLSKELKKVLYQTTKQLGQVLVPQMVDRISNQNLINLLNKLEVKILQDVDQMGDEHIILKVPGYDRPMREEDFYSISIQELVSFELLTSLQNELQTQKNLLFTVLSDCAEKAEDVDHIIQYSLGSAITAMEDDKSKEECLNIATEGIDRAETRLQEIDQKIEQAIAACQAALEETILKFSNGVTALCYNENVSELRMRITKAKAAQQAKAVRIQIRSQLIQQWEKLWFSVKASYKKSREIIRAIGSRFILTAGQPELTREVSNFLHDSQVALDGLPQIYQRLYQIEPLEDMELFEGRLLELDKLKTAYQSWSTGRMGGTIVLAEKWGGLTSFITYAVRNASLKHKVIRHTCEGNICTQQALLAELAEELGQSPELSLDDLIQQILEGPKRIIILEDIQKLYLRKVNGFDALSALGQLVSATSHHVFWLMSCTVYAYHYLSKATQISELFSDTITLADLNRDQIVNIISKRNRISGFNIRFDADEKRKQDKKFVRLSEVEQQEKLKATFFSELNDFSKSNISMALTFWLLSMRSIEGNDIYVGSFNQPKLNFLQALSSDKVYVLQALIMHDGLKTESLAEVLRVQWAKANTILLGLLEDGVVVREEQIYMVNPVVYRGVISLLTSKNLIH